MNSSGAEKSSVSSHSYTSKHSAIEFKSIKSKVLCVLSVAGTNTGHREWTNAAAVIQMNPILPQIKVQMMRIWNTVL